MSEAKSDTSLSELSLMFIMGLLFWSIEAWILSDIIWPTLHNVFPGMASFASKTMTFGQGLALTLFIGLLKHKTESKKHGL